MIELRDDETTRANGVETQIFKKNKGKTRLTLLHLIWSAVMVFLKTFGQQWKDL